MNISEIGSIGVGYIEDAEIQALRHCVENINKLDPPTRSRVVHYLSDRFGRPDTSLLR